MSSRTVLNSLRIRWFRSSMRSSLKTFSKGWSRENITSHMARAALQTQSALSAGLPRPPPRDRASPAHPGCPAALALPARKEPSGLSGPVPVNWWRALQQALDHFPGAPVGQQEKQGVHAVPGWRHTDVLQASVDATHDLWHLEGTQVRMVLPLERSHFPSCCHWNHCPSHPSLLA